MFILGCVFHKTFPKSHTFFLDVVHGTFVFDISFPIIWTFNNFKYWGWVGIVNLNQFYRYQKERNIFIRMFIQPLYGTAMFVTSLFGNPDNNISPFPRTIGDNLSQMVVICLTVLVFNNNVASICAVFCCKNIRTICPNGHFNSCRPKGYANFVT